MSDDTRELGDLRNRLDEQVAQENAKAAAERKLKADYKIQIWFRANRTLWGLNDYTLSFWESGKRLHGGGDELMRVCKRHAGAPKPRHIETLAMPKKDAAEKGGCGLLIPGGSIVRGLVQCPHCQLMHDPEHITTGIYYRTTMTDAADILATWWRKLDGRASLYAKYSPVDPRYLAMASEHSFNMAQEKKGLTVYTLERILQDTTVTGRTLESAFKAFVTA